MNRIRQFCAATVLIFSVTFTGFAGDMHTGITNPPPGQTSMTGSIDTPGVTASGTSNSETGAMDSVTVFVSYLFDSMVYSIF